MQLRASDDEKRNIGGALADAFANFDETGPFIKLLNALAPWAGVIDGFADAIYNRVLYVRDHRVRAGAPAPSARVYAAPATSPANGRSSYSDDDSETVYAPNPGAVQ